MANATRTEKKLLAQCDWVELRQEVRRAIAGLKPATGSKYFIWFNGKEYPPKRVRSRREGNRPLAEFTGGRATNRIFSDLGFAVVDGKKKLAEYKHSGNKRALTPPSIRELDSFKRGLLSQTWRPLTKDLAGIGSFPGVYLLAYGKKRKLKGERVNIEDVFYVGMSTTSLNKRVGQFWKGIHDGGQHSGAKTFFQRWAGRKSFKQLAELTDNAFFVATCPIECQPKKGLRRSTDLEKMGLVAALEFYVLAHIQRKLGIEPPLNKK